MEVAEFVGEATTFGTMMKPNNSNLQLCRQAQELEAFRLRM
jgi:hypothetical protein